MWRGTRASARQRLTLLRVVVDQAPAYPWWQKLLIYVFVIIPWAVCAGLSRCKSPNPTPPIGGYTKLGEKPDIGPDRGQPQ